MPLILRGFGPLPSLLHFCTLLATNQSSLGVSLRYPLAQALPVDGGASNGLLSVLLGPFLSFLELSRFFRDFPDFGDFLYWSFPLFSAY